MKILVCLSCVPDTTSKITFNSSNAFDSNGIQWVINPLDEFALTKAVQLQQSAGATVTVVCVGADDKQAVVSKALAIGANDAIRVNLDPTDSLSTAKEIFAAIQGQSFDLILAGKESIDYNGAAVPAMLAQMLNMPFVNAAIGLQVEGGQAKVNREIDGGKEEVQLALPAVIAGQKGLVDETELIIPNMRGIMSARTKPCQILAPQGAPAQVQAAGFETVPARSSVKLIAEDNLDELVRLLHEEAKVI
jgi:electron transfer flavoprotein beta subunit